MNITIMNRGRSKKVITLSCLVSQILWLDEVAEKIKIQGIGGKLNVLKKF